MPDNCRSFRVINETAHNSRVPVEIPNTLVSELTQGDASEFLKGIMKGPDFDKLEMEFIKAFANASGTPPKYFEGIPSTVKED